MAREKRKRVRKRDREIEREGEWEDQRERDIKGKYDIGTERKKGGNNTMCNRNIKCFVITPFNQGV